MVEIGESSFTYLQIFYSLDYGIPLLSYKIVCWVLALIFHIGCYIKDLRSTILNISQKMSGLDIYDLPKSLETSFPKWRWCPMEIILLSPPPIILPNPQVLEKFKVTQALLARQGLGVITSWRCSHILTSRESWVSKSWESWWFNHFLSHIVSSFGTPMKQTMTRPLMILSIC